ncbi:hypothetical protein [Chitinophaga nivalis]|uniref:Guanylate cyclase domain-containing protein n=1 Tax=Chitinophaga nivalis TaxID=2991709 RepID=A0ABT3IEW7_9BACT|nr:hypothetical protein [Chitinophaga nivalis]MCW3467810.1 hypothetical protein [Chitinophaga nivalis]MCW3482498.1 hypothetical protein [Chitinophaga nivalis]
MEKAIVLHADILGFKNLISQAEAEQGDDTLNMLKAALAEGVGTVKMFQQKLNLTTPIRYKLFSDNLYAAFPYQDGDPQSFSDAFLLCIAFARSYQAVMLDNKLFIRGGISFGKDYSDDITIFSVGLVKAYELEISLAVYPRILVDEELIKIIKDQGIETPGPIFLTIINNSILRDGAGLYFINPIGLLGDTGAEAHGLTGDQLDKGFIKRYIKYSEEVLRNLNLENQQEIKVSKKYDWFILLLKWLLSDRNNEQSNVNEFSSLRFKAS